MQTGIGQHCREIVVATNLTAVPQAELGGVQFAGRIDCSDLSVSGGIYRGDMRTSDPAVADDSDVVFFGSHARSGFGNQAQHRVSRLSNKQSAWKLCPP